MTDAADNAVRIERHARALLVTPAGPRLDSLTTPQLKQAVQEALAGVPSNIVLDLSRVTFMDSSGLGALVSLLKLVAPTGRLLLCCVGGRVAKLIELTRMDRVMPQHATRDAALAALA